MATMQELADSYGYQLAFLKSDKELYSVFQKAVNGGWDATRFVSAVRATGWYKKTSESARNAQQLKYTDPATYNAKVTQALASVTRISGEIGSTLSLAGRRNIAASVVSLGWDDNQVREVLSKYTAGATQGAAAQAKDQLKRTAYRNGVNVSDHWLDLWNKQITLGQATVEDAERQLRTHYAASLAPAFKKELEAGSDLADLASPYMQTMAKTLEINPAQVDLFDPTIRKALSGSADQNGKPTGEAVPLWQFETSLRKDPRWMETNNARDAADKVTRSLGQMFGLGV